MSNAAVSGTSNNEKFISPVLSDSEPSTFLFVNQTIASNAGSYKQGNRHDVRSHVRKHTAKVFGITHKAPRKRDSRLPKYAPLTTQGLHSGGSKHLEHDGDCPSKRLGPSTRNSGSLYEVPTLLEINESVDDSAQLSVAETPEPSEVQAALTTYCKTCGELLNRSKFKQSYRWEDKGPILRIPTRSNWKSPLKPSPVQVLGAGRTDPFSSLPMDEPSRYSQELMDHAVTYLMPGLIPDPAPPGEVNPLSKAWFTSGLQTPLLFHALVYAGSNHLDFVRWSNIFPNAPQPLSHKLVVIQKLNEALSDPDQASRDEIILAILILASQEVFLGKKGSGIPFDSPLTNVGWLNMYGNFKFVPQHTKAVGDIVTMRGGLEALELFGLAEIIATGDVVSATNSLAKPGFPPLESHLASIAAVRLWPKSLPRPLIQIQASAFWKLKEDGITDSMLNIFDSIGAFTLALDHYLRGRPFSLELGAIHRTRIAIQQRILSLPTVEELNLPSPQDKKNIYECCRLTALIFGVAVVFPVPSSYHVLQELVQRLKTAIGVLDIETFGGDLNKVTLWMLVLGGIAALEKPERPWYVSQLASIVRGLNIDEWDTVEDILESFLWLESACGRGGRLLWDEAMIASYSVPLRTTPEFE